MGLYQRPVDREYVVVELEAPAEICATCHKTLWVSQWRERGVQTLRGLRVLTLRDKRCHDFQCPGRASIQRHPGESAFALPNDSLGLDVLLFIAESHLQRHQSLAAVHRALLARGIKATEKTVGNAFRRFLALTRVSGHDGESAAARAEYLQNGGVVAMMDGVQFDETSAVLYIVKDTLSQRVVFAERHAVRSGEALRGILQRLKRLDVPILGVISDKETGLVPAIQAELPGVPHQFCQLHFLQQCAKPMESGLKQLGAEVDEMTQQLRQLRRDLLKRPLAPEAAVDEVAERKVVEKLLAAALAVAKVHGRAPLDPPALKRHERLQVVREKVDEAGRRKKRGSAGTGFTG